jgi:UDP-glucose 4-epimerase
VPEAKELVGDGDEMNLGTAGVGHQAVGEHEPHGGILAPPVGHEADLRGKRVVVTGGAGFIGSHLCEALLAGGNTVTCVDNLVGTAGSTRNLADAREHPRFELLTENVLNWADRADLSGVHCVFHLAASKHTVSLRDPERDLTVNGLGTLRLLRRAVRDGVSKIVHGSTGSVFGQTSDEHVEDGAKNPVSLYGISKLAGETYCRVIGDAFGLDYTILRYYHVIGPRQDASDDGGVVPIFARRGLEGRPLTIYGTGTQTRSFTSVRDVVRVTLLAASSEEMRNEDFNCASGVRVSIQELADFVLAETNSEQAIEYEPARPGDIEHFAVNNTKLRRLGVTFDLDWRSGVREVIAASRDSYRDAAALAGGAAEASGAQISGTAATTNW